MEEQEHSRFNSSNLNQLEDHMLDRITQDELLYDQEQTSKKRDVSEQILIDAAYMLLRKEKLTKLEFDIFMHAHGLDEYYPKKETKVIAKIMKRRKIKIFKGYTRTETIQMMRYRAAQKVKQEYQEIIE